MDERKKRLILIGGIVILLIILLLLFWPRGNDELAPAPQERPVTEVAPQEESQVAPLVVREVPSPTQASAEAIARSFAERFASFSAESYFANVRDLYPLMTSSFRAEQERQIASAMASDDYYGISSELTSLEVISFTETEAVMDAHLQRVEARGSATNTTTRQETLSLVLVFENDSWLVDEASWSGISALTSPGGLGIDFGEGETSVDTILDLFQ